MLAELTEKLRDGEALVSSCDTVFVRRIWANLYQLQDIFGAPQVRTFNNPEDAAYEFLRASDPIHTLWGTV